MSIYGRCQLCGEGETELRHETEHVQIGSRSAQVSQSYLKCRSCGEEYVPERLFEENLLRAVNVLREQEGLLSTEAIRRLREGLGLTQAQLEELLGTGPKTVVRWENGTVFPSKTADTLLRLLQAGGPFILRQLQQIQALRSGEYPIAGRDKWAASLLRESAHLSDRTAAWTSVTQSDVNRRVLHFLRHAYSESLSHAGESPREPENWNAILLWVAALARQEMSEAAHRAPFNVPDPK